MGNTKYNRIKIALVERDMTQDQFAKQIGKTTATVGNWCRNESQPTIQTLFEIAEILNVKPCDLLNIQNKDN